MDLRRSPLDTASRVAPRTIELLSPTRRALITNVKERGEVTADELAAVNYMSASGVRMHLSALEALGLVTHSAVASGPGRPRKVYRLTLAGEQLFPQCYMPVLEVLLDSLGPDVAAEPVWQAVEDRLVASFARSVHADTLRGRLAQMVESRALRMYSPVLREEGEQWAVTLRHCPLLSVAKSHPVLCHLEARVLARVLGDDVEVAMTETRLDGRSSCSMSVSRRSGTATVAPAASGSAHARLPDERFGP